MSYEALDWWHTNAHRYVDLRAEPELWALASILARHTDRDPRVGAWPSQTHLAEVLGVKTETVGRYAARLEATGVIKVIPRGGPQVPGKPGRRPHLYVFSALITAHGLPPTGPPGIGGNPGEDPSGVTSDAPAWDRRQSEGVTSNPRGGYLRSQGGVTSDRHAHDGGGRGTTTEGEEGKAADAAPPPACINHCKSHRHIPCDEVPRCGACAQRRQGNGRSCRDLADDDRELTRQEVIDLIGEDYRQPPMPPAELLDDMDACLAWQREQGQKRKAERQQKAKAALRERRHGSNIPDYFR